ncbi:4-hydroxybenzoate octaprenyltransferase [Sphingomicrobium sediminis]|uniref:4-hydroxybenzoate octaprenyltransferase n=1 Tax=Sphingomicrobium sediminis TaxID=2950949 RepID=A0A9X2EHH6_9SPHN|nr:4-hydroxybenzoate octaprenyltransferase [Sphingomicrobium sediminis]MCM8557647.1 4-hydroxybenzoate octaprenyltransferase [Sphingomicrobium sediminis]
MPANMDLVPDSERTGLIGALPQGWRPYAALMRLDRPIGTWLLYWPCAAGLALGGVNGRWDLFAWFLIGAFAMRSAGCAYNDIVDRDLDARVERTRNRPLASGRVSLKAAWTLTIALCLVGFVVLLQLPRIAAYVALASLFLVAAYPFMKRITWWPQAWLGLVFSWGALVGFAATGEADLARAGLLLWGGCVFWVIGYDTIYAIQDIEDDALVGVKSSARALGRKARSGVTILYFLALTLWGFALFTIKPNFLAPLALLPVAFHLAYQAVRIDPVDGAGALGLFRSNRWTGLLLALACASVGLSRVL